MGEDSKIQWCHHTFNPWTGCARVSPGCEHCYAESLAKRAPQTFGQWGHSTERRVTSDANWKKPEAWNRAAAKAGERHRVFCASVADVFEDRPELIMPRWRLWNLIWDTPNLDWLILTKRAREAHRWMNAWCDLSGDRDRDKDTGMPPMPYGPDAVREVYSSGRAHLFADVLEAMGVPPEGAAYPLYDWAAGPRFWAADVPPNLWLGVSVEDQRRADERIPLLLDTPAAVRFLSCEPLLGAVDLCDISAADGQWNALDRQEAADAAVEGDCDGVIDWVIVGGESGPGARAMDIAWARSIVAQCDVYDVPAFVKQLGARPELALTDDAIPYVLSVGHHIEAQRASLRLRNAKGGDPDQWPEDLRVREFPRAA